MTASFEAEIADDSQPTLHVFLPEWQVIQQGGEHIIILNTQINPDSVANRIQKDLNDRLNSMVGIRNEKVSDQRSQLIRLGQPKENFVYNQGVVNALNAIKAGELSKIVLARQLTFDLSSDLSPFAIAHALRARFPDCHAFSLSHPDQGTWVGASPETLARIRGLSLRTEALAGSAPRGPSAGKDAHWGKTILAREKEVREHRLVVGKAK